MVVHKLTATRKSTSGSTTIHGKPCILKEIIVSDAGQKSIVCIKDDTTIKMLFSLQQNTDAQGLMAYNIKCNMPMTTSLIAELYKLDPILFLNFNNNSTTIVEDLSGSNIDGTMNNMETADRTEDGERGKSINLSGTDEFITFGDNFNLPHNVAKSVSFWIKQTTVADGTIFCKWAGNPNAGYRIFVCSKKIRLYATQAAGAGILAAETTTGLSDDTWTHITITLDGTGKVAGTKFYINGVLDTTVSVTDTLSATTANTVPFVIGAFNNGASLHLTGQLDEILMFNRELSAAEVEFIYRNGYGYGACDGSRLGDITLVYEK